MPAPPEPNPGSLTVEDAVIDELLVMGWPEESKRNPTALLPIARETLERLIEGGLPEFNEGNRSLVDPYDALNFLRTLGRDGGEAIWQLYVESRRTLIERGSGGWPADGSSANIDLRAVRPSNPKRFVVRLIREFFLNEPHEHSLRLRVPNPYDDPYQRHRTVSLVECSQTVDKTTQGDGWFEVSVVPRAPIEEITVEMKYEIEASCARPSPETWKGTLGAEERALYTGGEEGLIRVTPYVSSLVQTAAPEGTAPREICDAFYKFFFSWLTSGHVYHGDLPSDDPLHALVERGWFDPLTGAALFSALCRSRGIPARIVGGWLLQPGCPLPHHWCEVWLDDAGWVPVDLYSWDLARGSIENLPWSRAFYGELDYRLRYECLPRITLGPLGIALPQASFTVRRSNGDWTQTGLHDRSDGRLVYRDSLIVEEAHTPKRFWGFSAH